MNYAFASSCCRFVLKFVWGLLRVGLGFLQGQFGLFSVCSGLFQGSKGLFRVGLVFLQGSSWFVVNRVYLGLT